MEWNQSGMEMEWKVEWKIFPWVKWNGKKLEWKMEWKWNGKSLLIIDGMEKNWNGKWNGMEWNLF